MTVIDRRYSVSEGTAIKAPCRVATTANITLGGLQTIDGVLVVEHDRVLVKNQSDQTTNGIYEASTGNWLRTKDFDGAFDIVDGTKVFVTSGAHSLTEYTVTTTDPITIGTSSITFSAAGDSILTQAQAAATLATSAAAALGNAAQTFDTLAQLAASTTPTGVNGARVLGNFSIGDDGEAVLLKVATPGIIKPWHKPSNNAWFELMNTVGTLKFFGGLSSGSTGNNSANNQALQDIAQWVQERKEAGCATEMTFHPGVYDYDDNGFNLAQQGATLRSIGQPILRYHGTSNGMIMDGLAASPAFGMKQFKMLGNLTVQSNSSAQNAIVVRSLHDADLDLTCGGGSASYAGLRLEFGVCSRLRYSCSSNTLDSGGDAWWSGGVAPLYGIYATELAVAPAVGYQTPSSYCTLLPVIEGLPYGVWLDACLGMQIQKGTIEGCSITALSIDAGSSNVIVDGTDFEANTSQGIYCVGSDCNFIGVACDIFTFGTNSPNAGTRNRIIGGQCNTIVFEAASAYNQVDTMFNITGTGGLTDSGSYNSTKGSFDATNAAYYTRPRATLTPSGSPYAIQNTTGDTMLVSVSGGTVSAIEVGPRAGTYFSTGTTSGVFTLAPKDKLLITYSVIPTVNQWGV